VLGNIYGVMTKKGKTRKKNRKISAKTGERKRQKRVPPEEKGV